MQIAKLIADLELISDYYAKKYDIDRNNEWYILKLMEEVGELTQSYLKLTGQARQEGQDAGALRLKFEDEVCDVLGQILLIARRHDMDLPTALQRKWLKYLPEAAEASAPRP